MQPFVEESITFLRSVGISVEIVSDELEGSFVPGVWMNEGRIVIHMETAHVADILHEAGHLATVPSEFRHLTRPGNFPGVLLGEACSNTMQERPFADENGVEDPVVRAFLQMGECEASAWSYAAITAMGAPDDLLIAPRADGSTPYGTVEQARDVLEMLRGNAYFGINGLVAGKFCTQRAFPKMRRWLAP